MDEEVILAWARGPEVDGAFADSVVGALLYDRVERGLIGGHISSTGPYIAFNRNEVVQTFLDDTDAKWLFWVDTDIVFTGEQMYELFALASTERLIVSGVYFSPRADRSLFSAPRGLEKIDGRWTAYEVVLPENELVEVGSNGMGFTLIHRQVFEDVAAAFPGPMIWYENELIDGEMWGEDLVFCKRAAQVGHKVWAHSGLIVGHRKLVTVRP